MTAPHLSSVAKELAPVANRPVWVMGGLTLQALGTAIPLFIGYERGVHEGVGANVTFATVRLIWHQMIHDPHDLPGIVLGVLLFVIGSVALARPFCRRRATLLIGVPAAALAGIVILGAVALLITLLVLAGGGDFGGGGGGGSKRKAERSSDEPEDRVL
jgi:hypothetical protein